MTLSLTSGESLLVVITEELVQKVNGLVGDIPLVLRRNEPCPRPLSVAVYGRPSVARRAEEVKKDQLSEEVVILSVEGYVILFEVLIESLRTQNLRDLYQLVIIIVPMEEWFFTEDLHTDEVNPSTGDVTRATSVAHCLPSKRTCIRNSTCPSYNRILGNPPEAPVL